MARTALQWLGLLFVVGLTAASFGALLVVKDRIQVVVQDGAPQPGPGPLLLLRDDVAAAARSTAELQQQLGSQFERLGTALEERAEHRHAAVVALRAEVAQLQAGLRSAADERRQLQTALARLQQQVAAAPTAAVTAAAPVTTPEPAAAAPPAAAEPPPTPAPAAAPAPPGKPFLSFRLPEATFRFDAPQDYALVPELSRVGFDAKSTLHDFTGVTSQVRGRFHADFDDPAGAWQGEVAVQAASLDTGVAGRDENLREHLATQQHPELHFAIRRFVPAAGGIDPAAMTAKGEIEGTMTIRGQSRAVRMPIAVAVDASKRVEIKGQMPLKLSDYGVPVPSQLGLIHMQDEVQVWVALRARLRRAEAR